MSLRRLGPAGGLVVLAPILTRCYLVQASPNPGNSDYEYFGVSCPAEVDIGSGRLTTSPGSGHGPRQCVCACVLKFATTPRVLRP
jgi:hypothetical protein